MTSGRTERRVGRPVVRPSALLPLGLPLGLPLVLIASLAARPAGAQAQCGVRNPGNGQMRDCTARVTVTMQLSMLATLSLSTASTSLTDGAPPSVVFAAARDTGYVVTGPRMQVLANRPVQVTVVNEPVFQGPVAKPASDVALGVTTVGASCAAAPMLPLATAPIVAQTAAPRVLLTTGATTAGVQRQVCFRVWWRVASDAPGRYTLPLEVSLTAP